MTKLNKLPVKNKVIHKLAVGESQTSIAEQVGVDQSQVSRFARKDDVRKLIEAKKQELISQLPSVVELVAKDIKANAKVSDNLHDNIENLETEDKLKLKTILDRTNVNVLKIAGILETPSNKYIHNQVNIQDNSTKISPAFQEYLDMKSDNRKIFDAQEGTESDDN